MHVFLVHTLSVDLKENIKVLHLKILQYPRCPFKKQTYLFCGIFKEKIFLFPFDRR